MFNENAILKDLQNKITKSIGKSKHRNQNKDQVFMFNAHQM